jgi:hypothetical protein
MWKPIGRGASQSGLGSRCCPRLGEGLKREAKSQEWASRPKWTAKESGRDTCSFWQPYED